MGNLSKPCSVAEFMANTVQTEGCSPVRLLMNETSFCDWVAAARPGDRVEYHRGCLMLDRSPSRTSLQPADRLALIALARLAMTAAINKYVFLVQKRLPDGRSSYLAVARRRPGVRRRRAGEGNAAGTGSATRQRPQPHSDYPSSNTADLVA